MPKPTHRWLIVILLLSVLLRAGVALYLGDATPPGQDETSYSSVASRLASGHGFSFDRPWYPFAPADAPTAHWSFLYTAFAGATYAVAGVHPLAVRLAQAVLVGILLPWLTYRLARRMTAGRGERETGSKGERDIHIATQSPIPLLAAALAAIYAYFVLYGAMVQTEAFYICALLWSLALGERLRLRSRLRSDASGHLDLSLSLNLGLSLTLGLSLGVATLLRQSILP